MKILDVKFTNEPGKYDGQGNCFFKLETGGTLKISAKDCIEVFITATDVAPMPFDRDKIAGQMEESLAENGYMTSDKETWIA